MEADTYRPAAKSYKFSTSYGKKCTYAPQKGRIFAFVKKSLNTMRNTFLMLAACVSVVANAQIKQVWDFGAEVLDETQYQNMLSVDEINSWYDASIAPGTSGVPFPAFTASDSVNLRYNTNGASNHRLRTTNTALTRYDEKSLKDASNTVYTGYIYSNSGKQPLVYLEQRFLAGDVVDYYVGSNGGEENYELAAPSGAVQRQHYGLSAKVEKLTFYIGEDGLYRFYGVDEKLVVARIVRTPVQMGQLTGSVTAPATIPSPFALVFTNRSNGKVYTATVENGAYSLALPLGYDYDLSLQNANGYILDGATSFTFTAAPQVLNFNIIAVDLVTVSGRITGLNATKLARLSWDFLLPEGKTYVPNLTYSFAGNDTLYQMQVEQGVAYILRPQGVNDDELTDSLVMATADLSGHDLVFVSKPVYGVTIVPTFLSLDDLSASLFTFTNRQEAGYVYTFNGPNGIQLRNGVYEVAVTNLPANSRQKLTSWLKINNADTVKTIDFETTLAPAPLPYQAQITVGQGKAYATLNEALQAVRRMNRTAGQRVTLLIEPGNYEEMLLIDEDEITLQNAAPAPSIALLNQGVDIDAQAVRITSYYGWGYDYYSMGADWLYDERVLQVNRENGALSTPNNQQGKAYWNATVVVTGKDFEAYDIIFENSFNQYVSQKEVGDIELENAGGKGIRPMEVGNTKVQERRFRERACALAFAKTADRAWLNRCRVVGRQDALYGDSGCRVAIDNSILNGACDYIFGGMTLACRNTVLGMLVTSDPNDRSYLTASKTDAGKRGYLFYQCHVTSAIPEVEMAETQTAQAGYFGRPWSPNAETVFFQTTVDTTATHRSLIDPTGWHNGLVSTGSPRSYEYQTTELSGENNSESRANWATVLSAPVLTDGTEITLYNFTQGTDGWDPFESTTAVNAVADDLQALIIPQQGSVQIAQLAHDTLLTVYALNGQLLLTQQLQANTVNTVRLGQGGYLLQLRQGHQQRLAKVLL